QATRRAPPPPPPPPPPPVAENDGGVEVPLPLSTALSCEPKPAAGFAPGFGGATYGNWLRNWTSFWLTPSPSGTMFPLSAPATTWRSMSTTSSVRRRPFG